MPYTQPQPFPAATPENATTMIDKKRIELEQFIREQTLGPGGMRSRFVDLREPEPLGMPGSPKTEGVMPPNPSPYAAELINTIPAGLYSTGILFPVDDTNRNGKEALKRQTEEDAAEEAEEEPDEAPEEQAPAETLGNSPEAPEEEETANIDAQSLNQMYPNAIGLTVCLDPMVAADNDLEIIVSGRYYRKQQFKTPQREIGVLLEQEYQVFHDFMKALPKNDALRYAVAIDDLPQGGHYLYFAGDPKELKKLRQGLIGLSKELLAELSVGEVESYKGLDHFKERLFSELRRNIPPDTPRGHEIARKLREVENFENSVGHIQHLLSIYDSAGYGLWKCESFEHRVAADVEIPVNFKGKKIFSPGMAPQLGDIHRVDYESDRWASMAVHLQYSKYERGEQAGNKLYLKIQLVNTSKHFSAQDTKNGKNYFSMASEEVNKRCFFGVAITVRSRHLLPSRSLELSKTRTYSEEEVNRYIYRQYEDYGLGHGCSVRWGKTTVPFVSSEYIPTQETPEVDPSPRPVLGDTRFLQFRWLSTLSDAGDEELLEGLREFVRGYESWIAQQQDKDHQAIADQIRLACLADQERMAKNIELLLKNPDTLLCFRLMNTAMFMQLWHSVNTKKEVVDRYIRVEDFQGFFAPFYKNKADDRLFTKTEHAAWRPFQLAFILLNLDGIFQRPDDPHWTARNEWVDLVWFPTGGGKTEAYLGLIALTIIHRRRAYKEFGGGTAVLMRYTLRLLTTQQFQRATLLIMALELIRRWETYGLGKEPIYIGLYVGSGSLPNRLGELEEELEELLAAQEAGKQTRSKLPLRRCPWCGHPMNPISFYKKEGPFDTGRILLECSRPDGACAFSSGYPMPRARTDQGPIPVSLCDEEIYQHPPALLFGTVDKFAQLAHKVSNDAKNRSSDSRRLFGRGNWETGKPKRGYRPPEMIIQDELHLMLGPLGSAVALFESAIDRLCRLWIGGGRYLRPKVISSTATTRNTPLQIMALFDRQVNLFPKPGINCDDSFFAYYKRQPTTGQDARYSSKRKYIGILPTGRTQMWMQLRLAAILFTHRAIFERQGLGARQPFEADAYSKELTEAIDNYHTVLAYFNSLREVGKTESQVYSYLIKEIRRVFNNVVRPGKLMHCFYTYAPSFHTGELTGRLSGQEVVGQMERIGEHWSPVKRSAHGPVEKVHPGDTPPDLVIATNMISVGIDISRLNNMIINCMPRNIAEYIQASSRVARDKPGLVITVHHPFRSRDLSHYERFIEFHEKMYSYVEPISITPFTRKALDRYLPLYIATIVRHLAGFPDRLHANDIANHQDTDLLQTLVSYFGERMERLQKNTDIEPAIKRLLTPENVEEIELLAKRAIRAWQYEHRSAKEAEEILVFNYKASNATTPQRQLYIDIDEYPDNIHSMLWRIPQSLRVVEPEAVIHVKQK